MSQNKLGWKNKNSYTISKLLVFGALTCFLLNSTSQQVLAQQSETKNTDINSVRMWHSPTKTRVVFDVSANIDYKIFSLKSPDRLVVDIENSTQKAELPTLEEGNNHIANIRFGTPEPDVLRFVFELKKVLKPHSFLLIPNELYGHRLVLDLIDESAEKPAVAIAEAALESINEISSSEAPPIHTDGEPLVKPDPSPLASEGAVVADPPLVIRPKTFIVAIDAGHGGEDPGASGHRGSREKDITLSIARRLKKIIDADKRMQAILIRTGDYYIDLQRRRLMAREKGADIFLSIHADAFTKRSANGLSVFALSQRGATSAMARALAAKENASDLIGGVSLANKDVVLAKVLVDLSMTNTISDSVNLGGRVLKELGKVGRLHSKRVEQANFAVLKSPDMPSILIETGFITNLAEEKRLRSSSYQKKIASAVYNALSDFHDQTPYYSQANYSSPVLDSGASSSGAGPINSSKSIAYHRIKRGDSLSLIALKYGMSLKELKRINKLKSNTAVLGQRLKVVGSRTQAGNLQSSGAQAVKRSNEKISFHVVKRGESLSSISAKYNVRINALKRLNGLKHSTVRLGQKIKLPVNTVIKKINQKHTVKRGDTLSEIAEQYGVTISELMKFNKMRSRTVFLGQSLSIPN